MPRVEVHPEASTPDPDGLEDAEQQQPATSTHDDAPATAPPARSVRRATARRASSRRATARSHQADVEASIIAFLIQHAGSTAGDLAKGLNLDPAHVSAHLTKLAQAGEIQKASHGYSATQALGSLTSSSVAR